MHHFCLYRLEDAVSLVKLYQLVNPDCKVSSSNLDPNMNKIEYLRVSGII